MSSYCDAYRELTDDKFIEAVLNGDGDAEGCFREIHIDQPVRRLVFNKFYWLKSDIEDISQEIWLYFKSRDWKVLSNFKNLPVQPGQTEKPPRLHSYLYGAASRLIAKQYKNSFGHLLIPLIFDDDGEEKELEIPTEGPERVFEREDMRERACNLTEILFSEVLISNSKAGVNDTEQKIVRMKCIMQPPLSSKEAGGLLKMTPGAVDTALSRARGKIRAFYEAKGLLKDVMEVLRDAAAF
jgi:DNA-directed RNA polymerase specialized sigma24 family protein